MSCGNGTFSPLKNTWSARGDLRMGSWDPYPELLPANERPQPVENYVTGDPSDCGSAYKWGLSTPNPIPVAQRSLMLNNVKENYDVCCRPQSYLPIDRTWAPQSRFGL